MGVVALRLLYVGIMVAILLLRRLSLFFSFIGKKKEIKEEKSWRAVVASRSTPRRKDRKMKVAYVQRVDLKSFLHFHFLVSSEHLTQLAYSSSVC